MDAKQTISAGGVVVNSGNKVLVVNQHGTSWSLPKGHVELGETIMDAAKREIEEESGITALQFVKELGNYQRYKIGQNGGEDTSEMKTIFMFLFRTVQDSIQPKEGMEISEAQWIDKNLVANLLTHQKDKLFFLEVLKEI